MKRFPIAFAVAAISLMSVSGAFAQDKGGVEINGRLENNTTATGNTNSASGASGGLFGIGGGGGKARQSIGSVVNTQVNGFLENNTVARDNANVSRNGANACQEIGVIGRHSKAKNFC